MLYMCLVFLVFHSVDVFDAFVAHRKVSDDLTLDAVLDTWQDGHGLRDRTTVHAVLIDL